MTTLQAEIDIINTIDVLEMYNLQCLYCGVNYESYPMCNYCDSCSDEVAMCYCGESYINHDCGVCTMCDAGYFPIHCMLCKCKEYERYKDIVEYYVCLTCFSKKFKSIDSTCKLNYISIIILIQRWWREIYYHPENTFAKKNS